MKIIRTCSKMGHKSAKGLPNTWKFSKSGNLIFSFNVPHFDALYLTNYAELDQAPIDEAVALM
jgi:hypothetical protein